MKKHLFLGLKTLVLLLLIFKGYSTKALDIDVRLYADKSVERAIITLDTGLYYILAYTDEEELVDTIYDVFSQDQLRTFYLRVAGNKVALQRGAESLGSFKNLRFSSRHPNKEFRIEANKKGRAYFGDLHFSVRQSHLQIINRVNIEKYVAGVVESEAGHVDQFEFYKAQAVLARTFAVKNLGKHLREGYNLKDDVSSQAYYSKAHYTNKKLIDSAVAATADTILVLQNCEPVLGVFHANSGGFTTNSEDVWLTEVDYLRAKRDSFSERVGSYQWEKRVEANLFYDYVAKRLKVANNLRLQKALLNFDQSTRQSYFTYDGKKLKLTRLRSHFGLRSTYFTVEKEGKNVLLKGRGFGHGVGLSQDGAIEMSRRGYAYRAILQFYFTGIELESLTRLNLEGAPLLP
jgi:stage II sporulation protein D